LEANAARVQCEAASEAARDTKLPYPAPILHKSQNAPIRAIRYGTSIDTTKACAVEIEGGRAAGSGVANN
jgi:hypothetical protein